MEEWQDSRKLQEVDGNRLKLDIWKGHRDTYHNLSSLFLQDARVAVLVYSIDDKNSFD